MDVWCYSNCNRVELFLNGQSLGTRQPLPPPDRSASIETVTAKSNTYPEHLSWQVRYQPGILRAVGTRSGKVACSRTIGTAGKPAKIQITQRMNQFMEEDRIPQLVADGRDAIVIKAAILDSDGHMVSTASPPVTFEVDGGATMWALNSFCLMVRLISCAAIVFITNGFGMFFLRLQSADRGQPRKDC